MAIGGMLTASPTDTVYQLIKSNEHQFPLPAPYFLINVGTLNATSGAFSGLSTTVDLDPEPIEHRPGQHIVNPPPRFQGTQWVSYTIDSHYRRTTTSTPAPKTPLAPVLLEFEITPSSLPWSVTANGVTVNAPAGQTTIKISVWDAPIATWSIQVGDHFHTDTLRLQRPKGMTNFGVGAFTIPVLPVTIIYAPPADSLKLSVASYGTGETVGTTLSTSFGNDSSSTVPTAQTEYGGMKDVTAALDALSVALSIAAGLPVGADAGAYTAASGITSGISTALGKFTSNVQTGISDLSEDSMTLTQATTNTFSTLATGGGPGVGDVVHFYKNVQMVWSLMNGQLRLAPLHFTEVQLTADFLKNTPTASRGISDADAQMLLALDPFVAGGPTTDLPAERFIFQENREYGGVTQGVYQTVATRETKSTTTTKSFTTTTNSWDPGPIFALIGLGGSDSTTLTLSNATGTDITSSVTLNYTLVSGPTDHFIVNVWYDTLFGTIAFQQVTPLTTPAFQGSGALPNQTVTLEAGGKHFNVTADKNGNYSFHSPNLPAGAATLRIGTKPAKPVTIIRERLT